MKTFYKILIAAGLLAVSSCCAAATINYTGILIDDTNAGVLDGTEVGFTDYFLAADDKAGNPTAEETWVNSILSPNDTATFTVKTGDVTYYSTDAADTFAFSLLDSDPRPAYFLVKNAQFMALFENDAYVGWGVFDINDILIDMNLGEWDEETGFTISHVTEFTSDGDKGVCNPIDDPTCNPPAVPIPPAVWLFGSGLIGLVGVARRKA